MMDDFITFQVKFFGCARSFLYMPKELSPRRGNLQQATQQHTIQTKPPLKEIVT